MELSGISRALALAKRAHCSSCEFRFSDRFKSGVKGWGEFRSTGLGLLVDSHPHLHQLREGAGGAERDRTADLLVANEALSQLSYIPTSA